MNPAAKHIRHGAGSVRPYLYGRLDLLDLVKRAFGKHLTPNPFPHGKGNR